jgi:hypothetical protein
VISSRASAAPRLTGIAAEISHYTDSAAAALARAADSRAAAEGTDVSRKPELAAAEAELAHLNRRIDTEILTDAGSGPAAAA